MLASIKEISKILGVSIRRINQMAADGEIKRVGRGQYPIEEAVQAYFNNPDNRGGNQNVNVLALKDEQAKLTKLKAYHESLDIKKLEGELCYTSDAKEMMERMIIAARNRFMTIPSQVKLQCPDVSDKAIKIIEDLIHKTLVEMGKDKIDDLLGLEMDEENLT